MTRERAADVAPPVSSNVGAGLGWLRALVTIGAAIALGIAARARPFRNPDVLWQIRTGEVILDTKQRLTHDVFSYAFPGAPVHDHEAGYEAFVAFVERHGGLPTLWWINLALVMIGVAVSIHLARRHVPEVAPRVAAASALVFVCTARLELRAETVSFIAFVVAHALRRRAALDPLGGAPFRAWYRFAPILVAAIAAPFHGLVLLIALVPLAHAIEGSIERWRGRGGSLTGVLGDVLVAIATVLMSELTAPGMIGNLVGTAASRVFVSHTIELYSLTHYVARTHDYLPVAALALAATAVVGLVLLARQDRARLADALLIFLILPAGFRWVRFALMAILATLPWAIAGVAMIIELATKKVGRAVAPALATVGCAFACYLATSELGMDEHIIGLDWSRQPVAAVAWLRTQRPNAALFHPYNYGGYLIYAHYPPRGVIIDGRGAMLYPGDYAARYYAAVSDPAAFAAWCETYPVDTVLLQRGHVGSAPLRHSLIDDPAWRAVYEDTVAIIFARRPTTP